MKLTLFFFSFIFLSITNDAQTELWGIAGGGAHGIGAIFKTDGSGNNQSVQYDFFRSEGSQPMGTDLIQASDGNFYGMTSLGGANSLGVLFQYDVVTNTYIKKIDFDGTNYGSKPYGSLIQASDGKLYGMTKEGGVNNIGVLFQYDPVTNIYSKKIDFDGIAKGNNPTGSLIQASDGKLYGMTLNGGSGGLGVLFQYDPLTDVFTKKVDFINGVNGKQPYGSLIQANDGNLYGLTTRGGASNDGVIFQFNINTNLYIKKFDFTMASTGSQPRGSLLQASNGKLYGMAMFGGSSGNGVLFQYDITTFVYIKKLDFAGTSNGQMPSGSLIQGSNGILYGMTADGGITNSGVLFQFDPVSSIYTKKIDFNLPANGLKPYGSLMQASDGNLYGLTNNGGIGSNGILFQYNPVTNVFVKKIGFNESLTGNSPVHALIQASDSKLYGTTSNGGGGIYNMGVLFQYDPITNVYIKKFDFDGTIGQSASSSLIQASDGKLYGLTAAGGANLYGVLFQYDIATNTYVKKIDFDGTVNGNSPNGALVQANDGMLYGVTSGGGANNKGVLFQYDPVSNILTKKIDFAGPSNGAAPNGALIQASDGNLYGITYQGGISNYGTIFQYNITSNVLTKKFDFAGVANGNNPTGSIIQASDGKLYGLVGAGGANSLGALFQYNFVTNTYAQKINFSGTPNGSKPLGTLKQAADGKLYGMTYNGGTNNKGILFQYDPVTNLIVKKVDFSGVNGSLPGGGNLIEITVTTTISTSPIVINNCAGGSLNIPFIASGTYSPSNVFTAQLSDATGSFASPVTIGLMTATTSNTISAMIPSFVASGSLYRVRVISSDPAIIGSDNGIDIMINATPTITVNSGAICTGQSFTINPSGASSYTYSTGSAVVTPTMSTNYTVTGSSGGTCIDTETLSVTVNPVPSLTISPAPELNCLNSVVGVTCTATGTFSWAGPGIASGSGTNIANVFLPGIYSVSVTDANSCQNTGTVAVNSNTAAPVFSLSPSTLSVCPGSTVGISANVTGTNSVSYLWDNSASTQSISVSPTVPTTYTATVTDNVNGCYTTNTISINVYALPTLTIAGTNSVCLGSSTTLTVTNGGIVSFSWSTGSVLSITQVMPLVNSIYTINTVDNNGCSNSQTVSVAVDNTCADVWPGDANSDGTADNLDVLELGLHYTQSGAPRAGVSNTWQSYFSNNWTGTITNGKNLNHSDCNGDGIINDDDTLAIYNNYGLTHSFKPIQTTTVNPQISIVPDQPMVVKGIWGTASVYLGDATTNINNINGVAFTVDFDNTLIEPSSIWIEYINSFIDVGQSLHFRKLDFTNNKLFTATTHTLANNVSGYGKIATLHYQISSSLTTDQTLNIGISQANQSDGSGVISPLTSGTATLMAIGASVGIKESIINEDILISPNPTNGILNISFNVVPQNIKIELYNSIGALVLAEPMSNKINTINTTELSSGIYFIKVIENDKLIAVKKVVKE